MAGKEIYYRLRYGERLKKNCKFRIFLYILLNFAALP